MSSIQTAEVIVAAGGLGTRVRRWSHILPKEFYPVDGQPGIVHLLDEIARLGRSRVVIVHHPYYTPFVSWARHALSPTGRRGYQQAAGLPDQPASQPPINLTWLEQHGPYADLTSVLIGAHHLGGDCFYVAFADNLYPDTEPLAALSTVTGEQVAVLARPYRRAEASHRGVIVARRCSDGPVLDGLIEKPSPQRAIDLEDRYGPGNLFLLEGRFRLTATFVRFARRRTSRRGEPKLSLTLRDFARQQPIRIVALDSEVVDLGDSASSVPGIEGLYRPNSCNPARSEPL